MEYCAGGSVSDLMRAADAPLSEDLIAFVTAHTLAGLAYLHSVGKVPAAAAAAAAVHEEPEHSPPQCHLHLPEDAGTGHSDSCCSGRQPVLRREDETAAWAVRSS